MNDLRKNFAWNIRTYFNLGYSHMSVKTEHDPNFVTTDVREYEESLYLLKALDDGANVFCRNGRRLMPVKIDFNEWIAKTFPKYILKKDSSGMAWVLGNDGNIPTRFAFDVHKNILNYEILGDIENVKKLEDILEEHGFSSEGVKIKWMFGNDYRTMDSFELPLSIQDAVEGTYPWMNESIEDYTIRFMNSKSSVLILIGPPGTGKTTFIKEIIRNSGTGAMVTYDTNLLFTDGFFASFMADEETDLLILEDADVVMKSRKEGNTMMHKFLNASDGLVSLPRKKIIFTTNLPSIKDVDDALIRKGRCFDVMPFRFLTKDEAGVVAKNFYKCEKVLTKNEYSLAEIFNLDEVGGTEEKKKAPRVGFM